MARNKVLIVEDDEMQQHMLSTLLQRKLELSSICVGDGHVALQTIEDHPNIFLVILDLNLPTLSGMEILDILKKRFPDMPVIMLTGSTELQDAVLAMKSGATDFITKPYDTDRLIITVRNALKISLLSREVKRLTHKEKGEFGFSDLIGHDSGLSAHVKTGRKAAQADIPVLITGETGVGKEVFARAIHGQSDRSNKPFIAVNCGAMPGQLVESILFGHEKGAFTGATDKTIGKFREADGGTIFLDEVGELPLDAQVKLLRVLQQKEVEPVGASKTVPVNVRIISATNRNLEDEIAQHHFRQDLYFRLNVLEISLPPLRNRKQDISMLARHFMGRFSAQENRPLAILSEQAEQYLQCHEWPGNVRELENTLNRSMVMDEDGVLDINDFKKIIKIKQDIFPASGSDDLMLQGHPFLNDDGSFKTIDIIEQNAMRMALNHYNGNITKASAAIGMAKSTFYRKLNQD